MANETVRLKKIISVASATGFWAKVFTYVDKKGPFEFMAVGFWLAAEFEWNDGTIQERVIPVVGHDFFYVNTTEAESETLLDSFSYEVFHESQFDIVGKVLRTEAQ